MLQVAKGRQNKKLCPANSKGKKAKNLVLKAKNTFSIIS